jgi:hypothetical protein
MQLSESEMRRLKARFQTLAIYGNNALLVELPLNPPTSARATATGTPTRYEVLDQRGVVVLAGPASELNLDRDTIERDGTVHIDQCEVTQ